MVDEWNYVERMNYNRAHYIELADELNDRLLARDRQIEEIRAVLDTPVAMSTGDAALNAIRRIRKILSEDETEEASG